MTTAQIAKVLKDKGFAAESDVDFVRVSLSTRWVSTMEVDAAMDFNAPVVGRIDGEVVLFGT